MNSSLSKLFKSQKSGNVHYLETDLIEAPTRKKLVDSRLMFEQSVENYNLADTAEAFKYYSISYAFAVDNMLYQFASIQRRISAQGVNKENIKQFGEAAKKQKELAFIYVLFQQFNTGSELNWQPFVRGYREAEMRIRGICEYIYNEKFTRQLTDAMIYTSFWELVASERIDLPVDF